MTAAEFNLGAAMVGGNRSAAREKPDNEFHPTPAEAVDAQRWHVGSLGQEEVGLVWCAPSCVQALVESGRIKLPHQPADLNRWSAHVHPRDDAHDLDAIRHVAGF